MTDLKLFGKQVKPPVAIGLAAGAVFVVIVVVRARRNSASSAASSASSAPSSAATLAATAAGGDPYPPDGSTGNSSDPYSTDPGTGQTYGDESYSGGTGGGGGFFAPPVSQQPPGSFVSNAAWSQAAEAYLAGNDGNAETIGNALGKYITGQRVTPAQQTVIESAIAFEGYPPVSAADGFPPGIRRDQGSAHPVPGPVEHKPTKAPGGERAEVSGTTVTLSWEPAKEATEYQLDVHRKTAGGGLATTFTGRVHGESHRLSGLARRADFRWTVAAVDKAGVGPRSPEHSFATK